MDHTLPPRSVVEAATDAVVRYALRALAPQFLVWPKDALMQAVEFIWNTGGRNIDPSVFHAPNGDLSELARRLCKARRAVPAEVDDVLLLDLDMHDDKGEVFFTFQLSWDEMRTFQPCQVTVDCLSDADDEGPA